MKSKLILMILGLSISTLTYANSTTHKHIHRHRAKCETNYPGEICATPQETLILNEATQNVGRAWPDPCQPFWFDRIQFSGGVNLDAGKFGSRNKGNHSPFITLNDGYAGENTRVVSLNDAYLNIFACVNEWTKAFISLSYSNPSDFYSIAYTTAPDSLIVGDINGSVRIEQAFLRIVNFDYTPIYFEFGQEFQDYGRYPLHPITESITQSMTETLHPSGKVAFLLDWGLHGSVSAFQVPVPKTPHGTLWFDYVGAIGLSREDCGFTYDLGFGYIYNIWGINLFGNTAALREGVSPQFAVFHKVVGGYALYGDVRYDPVTLSVRYTISSINFSPLDLTKDLEHSVGAKPWGASAQVGYEFCLWSFNQNIYLGYQISRDAVNLNLPRDRWVAGYNINVFHNTTASVEWDHDIAYPVAEGGAHGNTNLVTLRVAVKFG